jgi:hypothetical protein
MNEKYYCINGTLYTLSQKQYKKYTALFPSLTDFNNKAKWIIDNGKVKAYNIDTMSYIDLNDNNDLNTEIKETQVNNMFSKSLSESVKEFKKHLNCVVKFKKGLKVGDKVLDSTGNFKFEVFDGMPFSTKRLAARYFLADGKPLYKVYKKGDTTFYYYAANMIDVVRELDKAPKV